MPEEKTMRKKLITLLLATGMVVSLMTGCGSGNTAKEESVKAESKEVNVICWSEYVPDETVAGFEEKTGIKVNMTTYNSPDEMLAKVRTAGAGTYDFILCPENYTPIFKEQGLIEPLDKSKLPNSENIAKGYLGRTNDPTNEYSLPYMFAGVCIAVNRDVIKDEIKGYADIIKPEYKDTMAAIEDSRAMYAMAAMAGGFDSNDTSEETLAYVEEYWTALFPNIHAFDGASPKTLMINGECPMGLMYIAEALLAQKEVPSIECIYPEEGVYLGADCMMITKDGANKDNGYAFFNYILDAEVSAGITKIFPYINPNEKALEILGSEYLDNSLTNPPADVLERACTLIDIGDEQTKIVDLWTKLKG